MKYYLYEKQHGCCDKPLTVCRIVNDVVESMNQPSLIKSLLASKQEVIEFKALSKRRGITRNYDVKVGIVGSSGTIGQIAQGALSYAVPGDLSPLRSPVRSAAWTALTPGLPGGAGIRRRGPKRQYRCPEGYQYGGRFTDNKLSTCGQMLFDLPSALGQAIGQAVRRALRGPATVDASVTGEAIGAGPYGGNVIDSRRPQIPRVGEVNTKLRSERTAEIIKQMSEISGRPTRLVRKDGFVLEPVVSPMVLRAIPDNRDMVDATYVLKVQSQNELGNDELGLLSNTGVTNVTYALPGGHSISIAKVRPLTVGERRKLGRTVNSAATLPVNKDPLARLKYVASQTGDGIKISEKFNGIKNPHEMLATRNGRSIERWVTEVFKNRPKATPTAEVARETVSHSAIGSKISNIDDAIAHIGKGGPLSQIAPDVLQEVLRKENLLKAKNNLVITPNNQTYIVKSPRNEFEHLSSMFASDIQQHLGLESPDVAFIGAGSRRRYLIEDAESTLTGAQKSREFDLNAASTAEMAALMVADYLSGSDNRQASSVNMMTYEGKPKVIPSWASSDLIDLDKIKIRERSKQRIKEMRSVLEDGIYGKYFTALQKDQQQLMRQQLGRLLSRAQKFNFTTYRERLKVDGQLSPAELAHLNIIETIYNNKVKLLQTDLSDLISILGGKK